MDSALHDVWVAASTSPFVPTIGKDSHFLVGFSLLLLGIALSGAFVISMSTLPDIDSANRGY
jgi:cell cycle checkpoint protein